MVFTIGSSSGYGEGDQDRLGLADDWIWELIATEVVATIWSSILDLFGSIKTTMIKIFDDHYDALTETAAVVDTVVVAAMGGRSPP